MIFRYSYGFSFQDNRKFGPIKCNLCIRFSTKNTDKNCSIKHKDLWQKNWLNSFCIFDFQLQNVFILFMYELKRLYFVICVTLPNRSSLFLVEQTQRKKIQHFVLNSKLGIEITKISHTFSVHCFSLNDKMQKKNWIFPAYQTESKYYFCCMWKYRVSFFGAKIHAHT